MSQTVLIFGATGWTGGQIINSLLDTPDKFKVYAAVRPASLEKPVVAELKAHGATIVAIDLESTQDQLRDVLKGIDTVISAVVFTQLQLQHPLIDAAKEAGVKRFVPCDFGTPCVRGVRQLYDEKADIHDHIERVGLGHTYIDIGFWFQFHLPIVKETATYEGAAWLFEVSKYIIDGGKTKSAFTDLRDIGPFVARIIADPRTLNQYVFVWGEEVTQQEIFDIVRSAWGHEIVAVDKTGPEVRELMDNSEGSRAFTYWEYVYSMWVRGDNTLENAKKPEYGSALDAKELYPDITVRRLVDYAQEYYVE